MEEKYVIHLYKFNVQVIDRRDGSEKEIDIVLPYPVEAPEDLDTSREAIREYVGHLGYATSVNGITYVGQQAIGINLAGAYTGKLEGNVELLQEGDI